MGNIDFRVVQNPQSASQGVDRFSQGLSGLGQVMDQRDARAKEEAFANSPINPLQVQMLELMKLGQKRVGAGEDPVQVAAELKQHPIAQQYLQAAKGGGLAAPAMGQAQPVQVPQQAAPQLETPPPPPAYPPGYGQSLGAPPAAPRPMPQGPNVSGALNMGQPPPQAQPMSRISAAPIMTGATQPPRQEFGSQPAMSLGQSPPPMGPAPAPAPAPQAPPAPPQYTQRDYASVQGMFPTIMAAQGRNDAAQIRADVQRENSIRQNNTATFIAMLRERGMDADRASREGIEFAKLDLDGQKNALDNLTRVKTTGMNNATDVEVANINAGSRERVAAGREAGKAAKPGEDSAEKELRTLISAQANIASKPEWTKDADSVATFQSYRKRIAELQAAMGRPAGGTQPRTAPSASPAPTFSPQAPAPKPSKAPAQKVLNAQDTAALDWANQNPTDPRAKQIKAKLGR